MDASVETAINNWLNDQAIAEEDKEEIRKLCSEGDEKELPTKCPSCNAPLPPIYKGMQQVECEYCGTAVNI